MQNQPGGIREGFLEERVSKSSPKGLKQRPRGQKERDRSQLPGCVVGENGRQGQGRVRRREAQEIR